MIVDTGHIPRSDLYTFTAPGRGWVVQSWLASTIYGAVDDVAGLVGVRLLMGLLTFLLFAAVWRLARSVNGAVVKVGIVGLCLAVGAGEWSERPLLFGLLFLALTVLAGSGGLDPRWLLPIGWVWVNTHGSFPLGLVYLGVELVGRRLDGDLSAVEQRCLGWLAGGVALGALNPLGPRILLFPAELLQRQDILQEVIEWQAPSFQSFGQRIFLLQVALAVVALVRRPRYRHAFVLAVFVAAALLGQRNIPVASIVLVPLMAEAWTDVGGLRVHTRSGLASLLAVVGVVAVALSLTVRLGDDDLDLEAYPVAALDHLEDHHVDLEEVRLAAPDRVGNLIELRDGPGRRVFFDDRFDMFPERLSEDVLTLTHGGPGAKDVLDRYDIALVLWQRQQPLATILEGDPAWRLLYDRDERWVLLCRVGADIGGDLGGC